MIAIPDAGEIIAKVKVEYDGSGVEQAKKDLASLGEAGGAAGQGVGSASEGLNAFTEQAGKAAAGASGLGSALVDLPKIAEKSGTAFSAFGAGVAESQGAINDMGTSVQELQAPLEKTSSLLEKASAPMSVISEHAQSVSENFAQIGDSLTQSAPLLSQYADSMQNVVESTLAPNPMHLAENMAVFQDALANPYPFQMMQQHLNETGQTWGDFTSSIGSDNTQMLHEMATTSGQTHEILGGMSSNVQAMGQTFHESADSVQAFTDQFNGANDAVSRTSGQISSFTSMAADANKAISEGTASAVFYGESGKVLSPVGLGEGFRNGMGGVMGALNDIAMPLMAVQMIGMVVGQVGKGIYDMAAVAEGPGAHAVGSFTGTVDALGQTAAKVGQQFSEGFGQAVMPTLQQMNYEVSQNQSAGGIGGMLGQTGQFLFNSARVLSGMDFIGGLQGFANQYASSTGQPLPYQGPDPQTQAQIYTTQHMGQIPTTIAMQTAQAHVEYATILDEAVDKSSTGYLAAQDHLQAAQTFLAHAQQSYSISHPISQGQLANDAMAQRYADGFRQDFTSPDFTSHYPAGGAPPVQTATIYPDETPLQRTIIGAGLGAFTDANAGKLLPALGGMFSGGGIGSFFGGLSNIVSDLPGSIGNFFGNLFGGGQASVGCFPAGTRVRMADGSERAIETLQVGEQVLAHDGTKQVTTTILARIVPPPKKVYELAFSDGNTLMLTDSHPIATGEGWKSLHPRATKQENPDLIVSTLHIGDTIHTTSGTVKLVGILPRAVVQIYNLTVDEPHTFYANAILVHNKIASVSADQGIGSQISDMVGNIQLPHIDLSGMASSLGGSFSGIQLPHLDLSGIASGIGGSFSGIQLPHIDLSGIASGLGGAFSGIQLPHIDLSSITSGLSGAFSGIQLPSLNLSGITSSLSSAFSGIEMPSIPQIGSQISGQLSNMFSGISMPSIPQIGSQISGELGNMFSGISIPSVPQIGGMINGALGGIFSGISIPSVPEIGREISGAMGGMFSGISLPAVPNLGVMISGAMSGMFSGISMPAVPFFAGGVENFGGGAAVIAENGPELVMLPNGSSVYPLSTGGSTGANMTPVSLGGGGGSSGGAPQSFNISLHIDSQTLIAAMGIPMAQNIRLAAGLRSF